MTDQAAYSADYPVISVICRSSDEGLLFHNMGECCDMKLFLLGDSTCADKTPETRPETGWGECIQEYLADGWVVDNRAINGLSTKDMIAKGLFQAIVDDASEGDAALIQFGHNDSKSEDPMRYSAPWTQFIANLVYMADKLREKNVSTVFLTPIARRRFKDGIIVDTHGDYPAAMKAAAYQAGCPCIDLTIPTMVWLQKEDPEDSKKYFMNFGPGLYPNYPEGDSDDTHLRPDGAGYIAAMAADCLRRIPRFPAVL